MLKKIFASFIAFFSVMVFASTAVHAFWYAPPEEEVFVRESPLQRQMAPRPAEYPMRLTIPALDIDTKVQNVGITAKGTMSVPNNFSDVGWYKYGAAPGQRGSAVMAGHVDNAVGLPGVFKRLADLRVGDDIYIERKDGTSLHFVVEEIKSYGVSDAPLGKIFGRDDGAYLNLITCEGDWIQSQRQYDRRLVVYTKLVGEAPGQPTLQQSPDDSVDPPPQMPNAPLPESAETQLPVPVPESATTTDPATEILGDEANTEADSPPRGPGSQATGTVEI